MPIDPRIPLGVQAPSFDPLEVYGRALSLRSMLRQNRIGDLRERQLRAAVEAAPTVAAAEAAKSTAEVKKLDAETVKLELDNAAARTARARELLQGATDEVGFQAAQQGIQQLLGEQAPSVLGFLGPTYDPARVKSALASVTQADDFIKQQQDEWTRTYQGGQLEVQRQAEARQGREEMATAADRQADNRRAEATAAETARHNRTMEARAGQTAAAGPEWVTTADGKVVKRVPQAGDKPYDEVAVRQNAPQVNEKALEAMRAYGDDMLSVIDSLIDQDGNLQPNARGVIGGVQGVRPEWAYGSEASQKALAAIDRLQSMLNIETLRDMKAQSRTGATGFGALTERELNVVESSASTLRRRRQSDATYAAELKRLRGAIMAGRQGAGKKIRARDPQGRLHEADAGTPLPAGWKAEP